jgi:transcriptional regulator with XRE-family HTH domain
MSLIRKHISSLGITQDEFARRVAVSPQALSAWILGRKVPKRPTVRKLAAELKVSIEKLAADFYR